MDQTRLVSLHGQAAACIVPQSVQENLPTLRIELQQHTGRHNLFPEGPQCRCQ